MQAEPCDAKPLYRPHCAPLAMTSWGAAYMRVPLHPSSWAMHTAQPMW